MGEAAALAAAAVDEAMGEAGEGYGTGEPVGGAAVEYATGVLLSETTFPGRLDANWKLGRGAPEGEADTDASGAEDGVAAHSEPVGRTVTVT